MNKRKRISFLIPAHNEEKTIAEPLRALCALDDERIEVLVGLDGCADGTLDIVRSFGNVRYFELAERGGKPAVLARLAGEASGDILIVHDADWRFVATPEGLDSLIADFDDPRLGGVVLPPHNLPFLLDRKKVASRHYRTNGISTHWLNEFLIEVQTHREGDSLYVDRDRMIFPFTLDIFRAGAIPQAVTVADDLERLVLLLDAGWSVKVYNSPRLPYFEIIKKSFTAREHYRRRVRGHIARRQLGQATGYRADTVRLYRELLKFILRNARRIGFEDSCRIVSWLGLVAVTWLEAACRVAQGTPSARELWASRDAR